MKKNFTLLAVLFLAAGANAEIAFRGKYVKVTDFEGDGAYVLAAGDQAFSKLGSGKTYGYMPVATLTIQHDEIIACEETDIARVVFTAGNGGYYMQDSDGRYIGMTGSYNSFNVYTNNTTSNVSYIWSVSANGDGTFDIVNVDKKKHIWLSKNYKSWGSYPSKTDDYLAPSIFKYVEGDEGHEDEITTSTIGDLVTANKTVKAQVEGTIVAEYGKGFLVSDGTGHILVYLGVTPTYAVGDQVTVKGALAAYAGMLQFPAESTITKTGTTTVSTPSTEFSERDMDDMLGTNIVKYGQYTGTLSISGDYYNVTVPDCQTAVGSLSYPKAGLVSKEWDGCEVTVKGYFIGTSSEKYFNTMVTEITCDGGENPNKVDPVGTGVKEDPYNVSRFHDISVNDTTKAWVKGYVVGYLAGSLTKPRFDLTTDSVFASNILIADKTDCTNTNYCIPVEVKKNSKFYNAVNLAANPGVLGKEIVIEGEFIKYFGAQGIKNVSTFILDGKEISEKGGDDEEKPDSLTVAELIAKDNDGKMHYVTGYIVGYVGSSSFEDVRFNAYTLKSDSTVTNILLADNLIDATCVVTDLIPVQLPSGEVRNALNLYDNDNMWQAKVRLLGKSTAYFGVKGLKGVTKFEVLEPGTSRVDTALVEEEKALYFDLTGKQIASPKNGLYIRVAGGRTSKVLIK